MTFYAIRRTGVVCLLRKSSCWHFPSIAQGFTNYYLLTGFIPHRHHRYFTNTKFITQYACAIFITHQVHLIFKEPIYKLPFLFREWFLSSMYVKSQSFNTNVSQRHEEVTAVVPVNTDSPQPFNSEHRGSMFLPQAAFHLLDSTVSQTRKPQSEPHFSV
jgi:hypothetical protein